MPLACSQSPTQTNNERPPATTAGAFPHAPTRACVVVWKDVSNVLAVEEP